MLHREIIAVCSEIHTKHINKLCGQNAELLNVKLVVHIVNIGLEGVYELNFQEHKICCRVVQTLSALSYAYSTGAALKICLCFAILIRPHFSREHNTHFLLLPSFLLSSSVPKRFRLLWQRHKLFHPGNCLSGTRFLAGGGRVVVVVVVIVTSSAESASLLSAGLGLALSPGGSQLQKVKDERNASATAGVYLCLSESWESSGWEKKRK